MERCLSKDRILSQIPPLFGQKGPTFIFSGPNNIFCLTKNYGNHALLGMKLEVFKPDGTKFYPINNDFTFSSVMVHPELLTELLRIYGPEEDPHIISMPIPHRNLKFGNDERGVQFDMYVQTEEYHYVLEMQNYRSEDPMKRLHFYESMLRVSSAKEGIKCKDLPKICIIVFCTLDYLGSRKAFHDFDGAVDQFNQRFTNGSRILVYYTNRWNEFDEKRRPFLRYVQTQEISDAYSMRVHKEVERCNMNDEWRDEAGKRLIRDNECREEGRAEGRAEGREEGLQIGEAKGITIGEERGTEKTLKSISFRLYGQGMNHKDISEFLGIPVGKVQKYLSMA